MNSKQEISCRAIKYKLFDSKGIHCESLKYIHTVRIVTRDSKITYKLMRLKKRDFFDFWLTPQKPSPTPGLSTLPKSR